MAVGSWQQRILFFAQLRSVLVGGISLDRALELAGGRSGPYHLAAKAWAARVAGGEALHLGLRDSGEPPLVCALVEAGEASGHLDAMCREIEAFYSHCLMLKRLVIGRSIYPLLLIHVAMIMPAVVGVIAGGAAAWTILLGPLLLWGAIAALAIALAIGRRRGWAAWLAAELPGLRELTRQLVSANTCLVLRAAASSGMLYHRALELAAAACGNARWGARLSDQGQALMNGSCPTLSQALHRCQLPHDMVTILESAEIAGAVDQALMQMATVSRERFTSRLTWTMRVAVGLLMAIAMLIAVIAIFSMFFNVYLKPMQDLLDH